LRAFSKSFYVVGVYVLVRKTKMMQSTETRVDVNQVSRFLNKLLRHTPDEYGLRLNNRGWASEKDVRRVLASEFENVAESKAMKSDSYVGSVEVIQQVLEDDDVNRFQRESADREKYGFIRATRGHTVEYVDLRPVEVDEEKLQWFVVETSGRAVYAEAQSEARAKQLVQEESQNKVLSATTSETNPRSDNFQVLKNGPPFKAVTENPNSNYKAEAVNMGVSEASIITSRHPYRIRERSPSA